MGSFCMMSHLCPADATYFLCTTYKLLKALGDQGISTGSQRYTFTERLLTGVAKATFFCCTGYWYM